MKIRIVTGLALYALLSSFALLRAADPAPAVTVKGTMECAKCALHESTTCQNVLVVKEGDKTTNYYMTDCDVTKDMHKGVCMDAKDGVTCTGTVEDKDGKKWITCSKVDAPK